MRTASKLFIMLCLMSKKAKGSLKYSSLEEALHGLRATVLGSEDFSHSEKFLKSEEFSYYERLNSEEFSYYEKSNSEESTNSEEFSYYGKSNSEESSNSDEAPENVYRAGVGPNNGKEIVKATSKGPT